MAKSSSASKAAAAAGGGGKQGGKQGDVKEAGGKKGGQAAAAVAEQEEVFEQGEGVLARDSGELYEAKVGASVEVWFGWGVGVLFGLWGGGLCSSVSSFHPPTLPYPLTTHSA